MKLLFLATAFVILTLGSLTTRAATPNTPSTIGSNSQSSLAVVGSSSSHFAQIEAGKGIAPVSPTIVLTLVGLFLFGLRLMGLRQAHALAEHERHSHHGRSSTFHSLHTERSGRE